MVMIELSIDISMTNVMQLYIVAMVQQVNLKVISYVSRNYNKESTKRPFDVENVVVIAPIRLLFTSSSCLFTTNDGLSFTTRECRINIIYCMNVSCHGDNMEDK